MVTDDDNDKDLEFSAERAAADSIVNAFETLIERQNKLAERVEDLENEISDLHHKMMETVKGAGWFAGAFHSLALGYYSTARGAKEGKETTCV